MKKILLYGVALLAAVNYNAQVLESQDFNTFTTGNAVGQGGYALFNGTNADYQIVSGTNSGNYLSISASGGTSTTAATRYYYLDSSTLGDSWKNRTSSNNILAGEVDIFTGTSASITAGRAASYVFDAGGNGVIGISWNANTQTFNGYLGLTRIADGAEGGFNLTFGSPTFRTDTWYKVKYQYNSTTGVGKWTFPDGVTYVWDNSSNTAVQVRPGQAPAEHDFLNLSNLAAARAYGFDNYKLSASNDASLASNEVIVKGNISNITVYPNPTTDVLNVSNTKRLESYKIYDLSGKVVLEGKSTPPSVNVSKLEKGNYVISIETLENGSETRKFIKK